MILRLKKIININFQFNLFYFDLNFQKLSEISKKTSKLEVDPPIKDKTRQKSSQRSVRGQSAMTIKFVLNSKW